MEFILENQPAPEAVPPIDFRAQLNDEQFAEAANAAKASCPVSKALTGVDITLDAALEH